MFTVTYEWKEDPQFPDEGIQARYLLSASVEDFPRGYIDELTEEEAKKWNEGYQYRARVLTFDEHECGEVDYFNTLEEAKAFCEVTLRLIRK